MKRVASRLLSASVVLWLFVCCHVPNEAKASTCKAEVSKHKARGLRSSLLHATPQQVVDFSPEKDSLVYFHDPSERLSKALIDDVELAAFMLTDIAKVVVVDISGASNHTRSALAVRSAPAVRLFRGSKSPLASPRKPIPFTGQLNAQELVLFVVENLAPPSSQPVPVPEEHDKTRIWPLSSASELFMISSLRDTVVLGFFDKLGDSDDLYKFGIVHSMLKDKLQFALVLDESVASGFGVAVTHMPCVFLYKCTGHECEIKKAPYAPNDNSDAATTVFLRWVDSNRRMPMVDLTRNNMPSRLLNPEIPGVVLFADLSLASTAALVKILQHAASAYLDLININFCDISQPENQQLAAMLGLQRRQFPALFAVNNKKKFYYVANPEEHPPTELGIRLFLDQLLTGELTPLLPHDVPKPEFTPVWVRPEDALKAQEGESCPNRQKDDSEKIRKNDPSI